ncbi:hypothetical protein FKM82_018573, partial [Ascaphus truei]
AVISQVDQPREIHVAAGDRTGIPCNHSIANSYYMAWYQIISGESPILVISGSTSAEPIDRFRMTIDLKHKRTSLHIEPAHMKDSAVYYCAVRDTVTQTHRKPDPKPHTQLVYKKPYSVSKATEDKCDTGAVV